MGFNSEFKGLNDPMINKLNSVNEYHLKLYSARKAWRHLDPFPTQ